MDLGDRGGSERLGLEAREQLGPEVLAHDLLDLRERERRHLVHELPQLLDVDIREQVRPRGEQLAELQVGRAELLERLPELDGAFPRGRPLADHAELA